MNANVGIFGDKHMTRDLPYEFTRAGQYVRYEYAKKLLTTVIAPVPFSIHLGDFTDIKNTIDGKVMEDCYHIFKHLKKTLSILGNHDRSKNRDQYFSMVEMFDLTLPGFKLVDNIYTFDLDNYTFICTSYYAKQQDIENEVLKVAKNNQHGRQIIVLGHWQFYNELYHNGFKLQGFACEMFDRSNVRWILGHVHNPSEIIIDGKQIGYYLGVMNPKQFGEKQGKILLLDTKQKSEMLTDYPFGEAFIEVVYTGGGFDWDESWVPEIKYPDTTYLKVITSDLSFSPVIEETIMKRYGKRLRYFSISYRPADKMPETEGNVSVVKETKSLERYMIDACKRKGFDPNLTLPFHQKVMERIDS